MLTIFCKDHPNYLAIRRKPHEDCEACALLYILRHQWERDAEKKLGGLNPYQFINADKGAEDLRVKEAADLG
jgi:hypothetical protein